MSQYLAPNETALQKIKHIVVLMLETVRSTIYWVGFTTEKRRRAGRSLTACIPGCGILWTISTPTECRSSSRFIFKRTALRQRKAPRNQRRRPRNPITRCPNPTRAKATKIPIISCFNFTTSRSNIRRTRRISDSSIITKTRCFTER